MVLDGIRVLDLTNVLSGPFCTYHLALLGADVIKIEQPGRGDLARQLGANQELNRQLMGSSFIAQNSGKKSVTLDLKSPEGNAIFKRLVATSDVVVENFRPDVMSRLGLGYEALREIRPSLVYCAISGFGQNGPISGNPAYDQIIQGMSGIMSITGDDESAPLRVGYPVCDTLGGITAAFAIVSALVAARSDGEGRFIDVSMLDSTIVALGWVVSNYLTAGITPQPMGNENMTAAPSGTFRTADGLINIAANRQEQFVALCTLLQRTDLLEDPRFAEREPRKKHRAALRVELEAALASRPAIEWEPLLNGARVPAGAVLSVPQILDHPQIKARHLLQEIDGLMVNGAPARTVRAGFTVSGKPLQSRLPPPRLGEHTDAILTSIGITANEIDELRAASTI
jgi:CoA:oxalate CoA-transferase